MASQDERAEVLMATLLEAFCSGKPHDPSAPARRLEQAAIRKELVANRLEMERIERELNRLHRARQMRQDRSYGGGQLRGLGCHVGPLPSLEYYDNVTEDDECLV